MSETVTDVVIINRALARIGSKPIMALDEDTSLARQAVAVYYDVRDALLGKYPWEFAKKTFKLDELAEIPSNGFDAEHRWGNGFRFAFAMPGNRLSNPRKILTRPGSGADYPLRKFLLEEGRVYADVRPLWATFTVAAAPAIWTPAFRLAAITLVAAHLAVPVTHDRQLANDLREEAEGSPDTAGLGGLVGKAIAAEVSGQPGPPPLMITDDLTTAHMT